MDGKSVLPEVIVGRHIDNFRFFVFFPEEAGRLDPGDPFHINIQENDRKGFFQAEQRFSAFKFLYGNQKARLFEKFSKRFPVLPTVITNGYVQHAFFSFCFDCPQYKRNSPASQEVSHKVRFFRLKDRKKLQNHFRRNSFAAFL